MADPVRELETLRRFRGRKVFDHSIERLVGRLRDEASQRERRVGDLIAVWNTVVPARLARRSSVTGLRGGVATVDVESSTALYELDRALRSGLEQELRSRFSGTLGRVRVRLASAPMQD